MTFGKVTQTGNTELLAIVGGTVIDGNGGTAIGDGVILIDGKRIKAVGDRSLPVPPGSKQISAAGKFVIPGLMSPMSFLVEGTWPPEMIRLEGRYDEVAIEAAQLALKGGVTTVFDTWGPREPLIKARDAINHGEATAARIYLCGNWIGVGGPYSADMRPHFRDALGDPFVSRINALWEVNIGEELTRMPLAEVRQEVRRYVQSGVDFVTYPVNCHRPGAYQYIVFAPRVQRMIVEEAHTAGLPVLAIFATTEEGIHLALDAGADMVGLAPWGGKPMSAETVARVAKSGVPLYGSAIPADDLDWQRRSRVGVPGVLDALEASEIDLRGLISAGARLIASYQGALLTSDQMQAWAWAPPGSLAQFGEAHIRGLQALQQKGMSAVDALMTSTRNVAQAYKVDKELGTLEQGKLADLVILNRNPIENVDNYRSIHLVMKEGNIVDRDGLPSKHVWTSPPQKSN